MRRTLIAFTIAGTALLAGCGQGRDSLSRVVGPNPISDGHELIHRATTKNWSPDAEKALRSALATTGASTSAINCMVPKIMDTWTQNEWVNTTGDEPEVATLLSACGVEIAD